MAHELQSLQLRVDPPAPQRRLTVLVRLLLTIPHLVVLYFLGLALFVVTVFAWFAALVTGRHPAARFAGGVVRWQARVQGYLLLLTDQYPPFSLDPAPYPIVVALPDATHRRVTVFFRLLLAIPALILAQVVGTGAFLFALVGWIVTLVTGQLPRPLHEAASATLRFSTRTYSYLALLQSGYPSGLFGEGESAAEVAPTTRYEPELGQYVVEAVPAAPAEAPSGLAGLRPMPAERESPAAPFAAWPLRVGATARRLLIAQIVLGCVVTIAQYSISPPKLPASHPGTIGAPAPKP